MKFNRALQLAAGSLTLVGMAAVLPAQSLAQNSQMNDGNVGDVYQNDVRPESGGAGGTMNNNDMYRPSEMNQNQNQNGGNVGDVYRNDARPENGNTPSTIERIGGDEGGSGGNIFNNRGTDMNSPNRSTGAIDQPGMTDEEGDVGDVYNSNMGPERPNTMRLND